MVSYRPRSGDRYVGSPSALRFYSPKRHELRFVNQSINQSLSCQSRHILAIIVHSAALVNRFRTNSVTQSRPVSRAWFSPSPKRCSRPCTPPVRLFSVFIHFMYNLRFDRTPSAHAPPSSHLSTDTYIRTQTPHTNVAGIAYSNLTPPLATRYRPR